MDEQTRAPRKGHPRSRYTDRDIRNLPAGRHADGLGLYLLVDDTGAKRWLLRTLVHGKRRDIGLGGYPTTSLKQAREESLRLRRIARQGGDPLAERAKERRAVPTFKALAETVHEAYAASWKNAKHAQQWINTLGEYVFPHYGDKRVDHVDSADIMKAILPVWTAKPETARRVLQRIGSVMKFARAHRYRTDNPVEGLTKALPKQADVEEHHKALAYAEVPAFITTLRTSDATESARLAFEFLILTAARTGETLLATWSEIDLEARVWTIPAARMKMKREHRVPLADRCVEILKRAHEITGGEGYVFPGSKADKTLSNMVFTMQLRRMKVDATAHGFRSSFRDWTSERTNFVREVCEAALAHSVRDAVEAAYRRTDLFEKRRELMETWSRFATNAGGEVITLRVAS